MTPELAQFSDWTLALLPRLFLYPGGLWALIVLLALRMAVGGRAAVRPRALAAGLQGTQLAIATAWTALALLPLPGTEPLPFPIDRLALAGLIVFSLLVDRQASEGNGRRGSSPPWPPSSVDAASATVGGHGGPPLQVEPSEGLNGWAADEPSLTIAFALAVMAPVAQGRSLLNVEPGLAGWLALAAVATGIWALSSTSQGAIPGQLRMLAWFGLAAYPFWILVTQGVPGFWIGDAGLPTWTGIVLVSMVYAVAIIILVMKSKIQNPKSKIAVPTCWGLAVVALLVALVA